MTKLSELIVLSAEKAMKLQNKDGSMPPGHNGPRRDSDTPVRNTAHWIITFLKAYSYTRRDVFKKKAEQAANFLLSREARPMNAAFLCRFNPEKDPSNGLIGQAWVIEALSLACMELKNPEYGSVAKELFMLHPFEQKLSLWQGLSVDGNYRPINMAFNQQLWFATSGALICKYVGHDHEIASRVRCFMRQYGKYIDFYHNGLICHAIPMSSIQENRMKRMLGWRFSLRQKYSKRCLEQSIGYHSFNLYGFALLQGAYKSKDETWPKIGELGKALKYSISRGFFNSLDKNVYAYSYNPAGFEMGFVLTVFREVLKSKSDLLQDMRIWVEKQVKQHFCMKEGLMVKNTTDPNTLAARIYEATRLPDLEVNI